MTVRWPTGFRNPVDRPRRQEAVEDAEADRGLAAVLAGRGEVELAHRRRAAVGVPARRISRAARSVLRSIERDARRAGGATVSASTASDSRYGPETLHDVGDEAEEHARVGHEELRLVVVADERQAALEDAALLDVGDLRREVVALDAVGVVEEVQGVVDGQAEAGPPGDEALVDLGRDADLGDLVEDLRARRSAARPASCRRAARASPGGSARG